MRARFT
jgi:hypothetical protein